MYTLLGKTVWNRTVSGEINKNYDPSHKGNPGRLNIYATICALFLPIYLTLYLKKIYLIKIIYTTNNISDKENAGQNFRRTAPMAEIRIPYRVPLYHEPISECDKLKTV